MSTPKISNEMNLNSFTSQIPKNSTLIKIDSQYGPLNDPVRCGLSDCGTPHKRGYIIEFIADGVATRGIIGHVCGKRIFNRDWAQAVASHEARLRDAENRVAVQRFLETVPDIENRLRILLPYLEQCNVIKHQLLTYALSFMQECINACRSNHGKLECWYGNDFRHHKLAGQDFFTHDLNSNIKKMKVILNGICKIRSDPASIDAVEKFRSRFSNSSLFVNEITHLAKEANSALHPDNLKKSFYVLTPYTLRLCGALLQYRLPESNSDWVTIRDLANFRFPIT